MRVPDVQHIGRLEQLVHGQRVERVAKAFRGQHGMKVIAGRWLVERNV